MQKNYKNYQDKGTALWEKAKKVIPGGGQLLSKRAEMFLPKRWPAYFSRAKGVEIWDLDGKRYIDMTLMGFCALGYADPDVNKAVKMAVTNGSAATLNSPEEVELATLLCKLHPWAKMARFTRSGGEAMAVAVRIARAHSGKDKVAFCGYHGWSDWYLAANLASKKNLDGHLLPGLVPKGVPRALKGTALPFHYNRIKELERLTAKHEDIGVIIVEPLRHQEPKDGFLENVRDIAARIGAVLIFDEISIGWRMNLGGAHLLYKVNPDIAVFSKAISNGYPMAAIIGRKEVMQAAQETFISSTCWTERIGFAAALATIQKMRESKVFVHLERIGNMIGGGWKRIAEKHGLKITVVGPAPVITFSFDYGNDNQILRTLFTQEMLKRGFLASSTVYVSYAHKESHVNEYLESVDEVFRLIKAKREAGKVRQALEGPVAHADFQRLT